jgi:parallel beta-helix repeat protein
LPEKGIFVNTAASVLVTDTTIRDNGTYGLYLEGGARATVTRATISRNAGTGIMVWGSGANTTTADIANSTVDASSNGVDAYSAVASGLVKVSVRDSQITRNSNIGVLVECSPGGSATFSASNNMISNNGNAGMSSNFAGSKMWASGNTVSDNGTGLANNSGLFESAGNNAVRNNGTNKGGTISVVAME